MSTSKKLKKVSRRPQGSTGKSSGPPRHSGHLADYPAPVLYVFPKSLLAIRHSPLHNIDMLRVETEENAVLLAVKVVPGASRTRYLGEWDGRARIAVAAPPEKGKANKALIAFLADLFALRKSDVTVILGHTTSLKTIRIERATADAVRAVLQPGRS